MDRVVLSASVTLVEREIIRRAAKKRGVTVSYFLRQAGLAMAGEVLGKRLLVDSRMRNRSRVK